MGWQSCHYTWRKLNEDHAIWLNCKKIVPQLELCSGWWTSSHLCLEFSWLCNTDQRCVWLVRRTGNSQRAQSDPSLRRQEKIRACMFSQTSLNNSRFLCLSCQLIKHVECFQHPNELCISSHVESAVWRHLFWFHLFQNPGLSYGWGFFQ